jgi:hypothetical protein
VDVDPAIELRVKLAAARAVEPEPVAAEPEPELQDTDARRRSVHEQARAALDEIRRDET